MIYEIISPDAFLRRVMDASATLSAIYAIVRAAYSTRVAVDREFPRKTYGLAQEHVDSPHSRGRLDPVLIKSETIDLI
jgi:type I restriction enzyme R subunit